jgi:hypothetical protein
VTEIDAGHEAPGAATASGFFAPFFQTKIKRCIWHFSPYEGELNRSSTILGQIFVLKFIK